MLKISGASVFYWLFAVILLIQFSCSIPRKEEKKVHILITGLSDPRWDRQLSTLGEHYLLQGHLKDLPQVSTSVIWESVFLSDTLVINPDDLIWVHHPEHLHWTQRPEVSQFVSKLSAHFQRGGKILLSMSALQFLTDLGLEDYPPDTLILEAKDEGYGRQFGFHGFLDHPLFKDLHGGVLLFNPPMDTIVRQTGYLRTDVIPRGKVIGVDWSYITFHEDKKLILEYHHPSGGKILAIGAYLNFEIPTRNQEEFRKFLQNCIQYLAFSDAQKHNYWHYGEATVQSREPEGHHIKKFSNKTWNVTPGELSYEISNPGNDFWDLTGRRLMVMGKEKSGIDEIWVHPFMAVRDLFTGFLDEKSQSIQWLNELPSTTIITPEAIIRDFRTGTGQLREIITVHPDKPVAAIQYHYRGDPRELLITLKSNLRLMWPYSHRVLGTLNYSWNPKTNTLEIHDFRDYFRTMAGFTRTPDKFLCGRYNGISFTDGKLTGTSTSLVQVQAAASFRMSDDFVLHLVVSASNGNDPNLKKIHTRALRKPQQIYLASKGYYRDLFHNKLIISSPDDFFNKAYHWALIGVDRHFANTPGIGQSFLAGIGTTARGWNGRHEINGRPGYAWYFGRDGQWSGMAVVDYGDFEKIRETLKLFVKYQATSGKIFHELTTSGAVHYDAADASPLFVVLAGRYLRSSGDLPFIKEILPAIEKAMDFCYSTDTDQDGLIENTNVGHGWVEGGFLFGGKTELYLASCWAQALLEAAYIQEAVGNPTLATRYATDASNVIDIINQRFYNSAGEFFNHSLKTDNTFIEENTIMTAIPVLFGHISDKKANKSLKEFASNRFSTNWGLRIVADDNPKFHPGGYHTGSVWPLYTGWVALAEYRQLRTVQAFSHIVGTMMVKNHWAKGFVEEVLHGEVYRPFGVCSHQCWSESMILQPLIEGMLGYQPDAIQQRLSLSPSFPADWHQAEIKNLRVGNKLIHMDYSRTDKLVAFRFDSPEASSVKVKLTPVLPAGSQIHSIRVNYSEISEPAIHYHPEATIPEIEFSLDRTARIEIDVEGGFSVIPPRHMCSPGDSAAGLRIIDSRVENNMFVIELEAPAGKEYILDCLVNYPQVRNIHNARLLEFREGIARITVNFIGESRYIRKKITIEV